MIKFLRLNVKKQYHAIMLSADFSAYKLFLLRTYQSLSDKFNQNYNLFHGFGLSYFHSFTI